MPSAAEIAKKIRSTDLASARADYERLKAGACGGWTPLARAGLGALDHFFLQHRIKAKTKRNISFYEALRDSKIDAYLAEKVKKLKADRLMNTAERVLRLKYAMFQLYYGTINQFRPTEAVKLYCEFKPKVGILDFSAGWGGRCLAAMALGIPYIGIDANTALEPTYKEMIKAYEPAADVKLVFKPSETVDFSRFKYDLVFTSPPYFMIEGYEHMPAYKGKEAFLDSFFRPVVEKSWQHLAPGGTFALNLPVEMYEAVRDCLPPLSRRIELSLSGRHAVNAARGTTPGSSAEYKEYIYVWRKPAGRRKATVSCRRKVGGAERTGEKGTRKRRA